MVSVATGEVPIEPIKLNRERAEAEKETKKKKRRQKKVKNKDWKNGQTEQKRQNEDKRHKDDRSAVDHERSDHQRKKEYETQGLVNIIFTKDLEQPMINESLYDSSDSTESIRRKKLMSSPNSCNNHGQCASVCFFASAVVLLVRFVIINRY